MKKRIIIAGGTGFLGVALAKRLTDHNYEPVILSRNPDRYRGSERAVLWDGRTIDDWVAEFEGAAAVVNLTGKNVNCRPSLKNREAILQSRVNSVAVIGEALRLIESYPPTWIQAGSLAIYGDAGERICDEAARVATGYPANVCIDWEAELGRAVRPEMRWVNLRIGFVLGKQGGALPFLSRLTRLGLGGSIGSGDQYISWIGLEDMLRIFLEAIENPTIEGTYNATGNQPVTNREFMATLRNVLHRPWSPAAPSLAVRLGAPLLNSDPEIALTGRRCIPAKLISEGFSFVHEDLRTTLETIYQ